MTWSLCTNCVENDVIFLFPQSEKLGTCMGGNKIKNSLPTKNLSIWKQFTFLFVWQRSLVINIVQLSHVCARDFMSCTIFVSTQLFTNSLGIIYLTCRTSRFKSFFIQSFPLSQSKYDLFMLVCFLFFLSQELNHGTSRAVRTHVAHC